MCYEDSQCVTKIAQDVAEIITLNEYALSQVERCQGILVGRSTDSSQHAPGPCGSPSASELV